MTQNNDSILDRVIATQIREEQAQFNPKITVDNLLDTLSERDKNVLSLRHGLITDDKKRTLEEIGKKYSITRERVRQIEVSGVKILKEQLKNKEEYLHSLNVVEQIIKEQGGVIEENDLVTKIKENIHEKISDNYIIFFLNLIKDRFIIINESSKVKASLRLTEFDVDILYKVLTAAENLMKEIGEILSFEEFWRSFQKIPDFPLLVDKIDKEIFLSYIKISKILKQNSFNDWGIAKWNLITPKRMNDKIYLILKHNEKPLHFRKISEKINEIKFDGKKAHPATIHNELILDHSRYVLVGRGIYALKEWGYKPGIVSDVIKEILNESDRPLNREEIIAQVLKKRIVKKTTIILSLMNKEKFEKLEDNTYQIIS